MYQTKYVAKMARLIAEAPVELRFVLNTVKMTSSKAENMSSLGATNTNKEFLVKTLGQLRKIDMDYESITILLKDGKKDLIIWVYLCSRCDEKVEKEQEIREAIPKKNLFLC